MEGIEVDSKEAAEGVTEGEERDGSWVRRSKASIRPNRSNSCLTASAVNVDAWAEASDAS